MNQSSGSFQKEFFVRLGKRFISRSELVAGIGEVLHVGRDAVYRRLRGDTALSVDELMMLSHEFAVPLEGPRPASELPTMGYPNGVNRIESEIDYFVQLRKQTRGFAGLPGVSIDYATPELPVFYELATPILRSFKVFMYGITAWQLEKWEGKKFSPDLVDPEIHGIAEDIIRDAYGIAGRELWSVGILDVTLRQINYIAQIGRFTRVEDIDALFDELGQIVDHLERMARSGRRFYPGEEPTPDCPEFFVYHNELSNTNNAILIKSEGQTVLFSTLVNPNYLVGTDERICTDVQRWFNRLVENGNALNAEAGKYTLQYFGRLRSQIKSQWERTRVSALIF